MNTDGIEENTIKIEVWYGCEESQKDGGMDIFIILSTFKNQIYS